MGRLVLRYEESKNLSGEAYIQSSNTNSPGIIKTSQKIERLSKTRALALDNCIYASPERFWIPHSVTGRNTNLPIGSLYKVPHYSRHFYFVTSLRIRSIASDKRPVKNNGLATLDSLPGKRELQS